MIFHIHVDNFIKKLFEILISQAFEEFFNILADSQFEPPLLIIENPFDHWDQIFHCCFFANHLMQVTNMCNDANPD